MFSKYIIRLDDACPTMNHHHWKRFEKLLDNYHIKPIVAVVPNNQDKNLMVNQENKSFWYTVQKWQEKNWEIALHGFEHKYVSKAPSLVPINNYSEFAGLSLEEQCSKIKQGIAIFKTHNISCQSWIAPAHSFDENTIKALQQESDIKIISDGIALNPYYQYGMHWIPQQLWKPREMWFGTWTICYHPDEMEDKDFNRLENFLERNADKCVAIHELKLKKNKKTFIDKIFEKIYWKLLAKKQAS